MQTVTHFNASKLLNTLVYPLDFSKNQMIAISDV